MLEGAIDEEGGCVDNKLPPIPIWGEGGAKSFLRESTSGKASDRRAASCVFDVGGDEGSICGESRTSGGCVKEFRGPGIWL